MDYCYIKTVFLMILVWCLLSVGLSEGICQASAADNTLTPEAQEALARQVEQEGYLRQALTHYVSALRATPEGSAANQQLREKIIKLAQRIQPPPALPEEARKASIRGQVAIREAKEQSDYKDAVKEFRKALRIAPWWADAYFNLAVAQENARQFRDAISSLKLYLIASPDSADAIAVRNNIYALEYKLEKAKKKVRKKQQKKSLDSLSGSWSARVWGGSDIIYRSRQLRVQSPRPSRNGKWRTFHTDSPVHVEIKGNSIRIDMTGNNGRLRLKYIGTIDGNHITGTLVNYDDLQLFCSKTRDYNFEGEIWPKDQVIMVITEDCHIQMPSDKRCYYQAKGCF